MRAGLPYGDEGVGSYHRLLACMELILSAVTDAERESKKTEHERGFAFGT